MVFHQSKLVVSMMMLMIISCDSFATRNIISPGILKCKWCNILDQKIVSTSKLSATTVEEFELIGMDSVINAVDDKLFRADDFVGPEKTRRTAITNFDLLLNTTTVDEFSSLLKQIASKRRPIRDLDRPALSRAVLERFELLNNELFSDCVWSLGTLRCTVDDFSAFDSTIKGEDSITYFWDNVARVSKSADRLCLIRLAIGLGKMGLKWDNLPMSTRSSLLNLIDQKPSQETGDGSLSIVHIESRELATLLFTLGQLGMTKEILQEGSLTRILDEVAAIAINFTPQGLSNSLNGLARMGVLWDDLPIKARNQLPDRGAAIVAEMRPDELCSIMQSMAVMKAQWSLFPSGYRSELLAALEITLPTLNNRELSNILWALGKLNVDYNLDLSVGFRDALMSCLIAAADNLKLFDLESIFVGLGLMQVDFRTLSFETKESLLGCVERHLSSMNIFCTYNVLWGLARMGASTVALGPSLSSSMLEKVVSILHTFLPTQYGDVIWSLGSLGYNKSDFSTVMSDRMLAVLSRVYGKLHVRAAAYTLWGLSKMGLHWRDMQERTRSLAGGREADPLAESVIKYLRQRVASMREHEYSVLLYSLGGLKVQFQPGSDLSLPDYVTDKIYHRATRVKQFLTSRSLASALYGLGKCEVSWMKMPTETRNAWMDAMLQQFSPSMNSNKDTDQSKKGLSGMRPMEFSQTIYGLGLLQTPWASLSFPIRQALCREVGLPSRTNNMDLHSLSSSLWGFSAMGCPLNEIPPQLLEAARERLWSDSDGSIATDQNVEIDGISITGDSDKNLRLIEIDSSKIFEELNSGDSFNESSMNSDENYRVIESGDGTVRQQQSSRRVLKNSLEEGGLSLSLGLDAMARLNATLSPEEIKAISIRLESLAPHMVPDTIVTCLAGLSGLGLVWTTDLAVHTRQTFLSRLKRSPKDLNDTKRKSLADSLKKMQAT